MPDTQTRSRFIITLEARPGSETAGLKKFLKLALRVAGLRCVRIETCSNSEPEK